MENIQNNWLEALFLGSFTFAQQPQICCVYKPEKAIKFNQNGAAKPIVPL